ncbi:Mut7-C RNAse domain-containing protein [Actinopolyspora biskrensis]|nr:Mut7-C RNAse domain-containing protein [Actinopolyspora biskrensis]
MSVPERNAGGAVPGAVFVRLAAELRLFAAPRNRRERLRVPHDGTASVGHVVQSLGVPLTEVGGLFLDGAAATPETRPTDGSLLEVRPLDWPEHVRRRFVLDVHLGTLTRRLRLLGLDTAYRNDATDDELVEQAARQRRVLLSRDRGLLRRRKLPEGAFVRSSRPDDQLREVLNRFAPPLRPWSRCVSCNGSLEAVSKGEVSARLEPGTRGCYDVFARCRSCGRVYWRGAHSRELEGIVEAARAAHPGPPDRPGSG